MEIKIKYLYPIPTTLYLTELDTVVWVVDNLLLDHVGLPQVVIVAVHLVILFAGWVKGIILRHIY